MSPNASVQFLLLVQCNYFKLTISLVGMTSCCSIINWHSNFDGFKLRSLVPGLEESLVSVEQLRNVVLPGGRRLHRAVLSSAVACDISMPSWQCFAFPAVHGWRAWRWVIKLWTSKQSWGGRGFEEQEITRTVSCGLLCLGCNLMWSWAVSSAPAPPGTSSSLSKYGTGSFIPLELQSNSLRAFPKLNGVICTAV